MPDEGHGRPRRLQNVHLEGQDHRDVVGVAGQRGRPPGLPGPHLGRDVVQDRDTPVVRGLGDAEVEPRVIHGNHQIDRARVQERGDAAQESPEEGEVAHHLHEAHDGQLVQACHELHALRGHAGTAESHEAAAGKTATEGSRHAGTVLVS